MLLFEMKKSINFICVFLFAVLYNGKSVYCQVTIDKKIQFDTVPSGPRTIQGLVLTNDSTSGIPYSAYIETALNYVSSPSGGAVLNISLPNPVSGYLSGFELFIKASTSNSGSLFLDINGSGPVEVKKRDTISLVNNEIISGQVFKVIYNGAYFVLQSPSALKCPPGFVSANDNFCIEIIERTPSIISYSS
jgi:hypothetical protein